MAVHLPARPHRVQPVGHIVDFAGNDDPTVVLGRMAGNFVLREDLLLRLLRHAARSSMSKTL